MLFTFFDILKGDLLLRFVRYYTGEVELLEVYVFDVGTGKWVPFYA